MSSSARRRRSPSSSRRHSRSSSRGRSRDQSRGKSREYSRKRSRSRSRDYDRRSKRRSPSPRRRTRSPVRRRRSPWGRGDDRRGGRGGGRLPGPERRDVMPFTARGSPPPNAKIDLTPEERDDRTVFILSLARDTRPDDLEEFFTSVGPVRDVRIITDSKTRRSKGVAYVEFWKQETVPLALALHGQKLRNSPLVIQRTCAERNRLASGTVGSAIGFGPSAVGGPLKLQISNLHPSITNDMLTQIFEPFGRVHRCYVEQTPSGQSKGVGYVVFKAVDDGKKAMGQLNGFNLAGKEISVNPVDEETPTGHESLDDRSLNSSGRFALMTKLAEGQQSSAVSSDPQIAGSGTDEPKVESDVGQQEAGVPEYATQCILLTNMFDPSTETQEQWELEVRDDVVVECNENGGAVHVFVDKTSEAGNVYLKCPTVLAAYKVVTALHGRVFGGKVIVANYVPSDSYHNYFPESKYAASLLQPRSS